MDRDAAEELSRGQVVRAADGRRLGRLVDLEEDALVVERGFFWPQRFRLPRSAVEGVEGRSVRLRHTREALQQEGAGPWADALPERLPPSGTREEVNVPLSAEEARLEVTVRQTGQLRVRKVVRVEERHFTVRLRREELVVERMPIGEEAVSADVAAAALPHFLEEEQEFTLWREEVELHKHVVPYEQVRLTRQVHEEQVHETVPLRYEVAHVEEEGRVDVEYVPPAQH